MERSAKFEEVRIPLIERTRGLDSVSGVLGIPEWWPTGERIALAIAHDRGSDHSEPLLEYLHQSLTRSQIMTIRFNFPFAEKSKRAKPDSIETLEMAYKCALSILGRDPTAKPAHLFLGGIGLGARVAGRLAANEQLPIGGLLMLSYPLHAAGAPDEVQVDGLTRIISPMLFVHGSEDPTCEPQALHRALSRIGAPTTPYRIQGAGAKLIAPQDLPPPPVPREDHAGEQMAAPAVEKPDPAAPLGPAEHLAKTMVNWIEHIVDGV
jgi:predicted alpha/beta-hydrolase family hydrolase